MNAKLPLGILTAAALACFSCDKEPAKPQIVSGAATTEFAEPMPVTAPSTITWIDIPTDPPVDFKTPLGEGFKIKKSGLAWRVDNEGSGNPAADIGHKVEIRFTMYHMNMTLIESNMD